MTVRDLTLFSAWSSTIWMLFGSQPRRMTSTLPSRPRNNYLAALVQAAVQHDQVRYAAAQELLQVMHEPAFGRDVHLMCSRVQYREGGALADLRLAARYSSNLFKMRLFIDRERPRLLDPA